MTETRIIDVGDWLKMDKAFKANVSHAASGGRHVFRCKKGLWCVDAPAEEDAKREAWHYFRQYYEDGEYDE